jgi:sugar phosphate isomerase/epimerase
MIILTPARARVKADIVLREKILERIKGNQTKGFEVVLPGGPQGDLKYAKQIVRNLKKYSENPAFYLTMHGPVERKRLYSKTTDLTTEEGLKTLEKVMKLAKAINARILNVHIEKFYSGRDLQGKKISQIQRRKLQDKVRKGVLKIKRKIKFKGKVALEDIFPAMMADVPSYNTVRKMVFDALLVTLKDCQHIAAVKQDLGVCLDICHYGLTRETINRYLKNRKESKELGWGLSGLSEKDIEPQPDLMTFAKRMGEKLFYVHFSDFKGFWIPGKSYYTEGLAPGDGWYNKKELVKFWNYLKKNNIPVNLEVKDKNLKILKRTKKAISWINNN